MNSLVLRSGSQFPVSRYANRLWVTGFSSSKTAFVMRLFMRRPSTFRPWY